MAYYSGGCASTPWIHLHVHQKTSTSIHLEDPPNPVILSSMITDNEIKEMSIDQKLRLMEAIWTEISRTSDSYESPDWHREELEETEKRRASGKGSFNRLGGSQGKAEKPRE